jgi:hypothetical protein
MTTKAGMTRQGVRDLDHLTPSRNVASGDEPAPRTSDEPAPAPATVTGGHRVPADDEGIDEAGLGSFPASDSPPWTSGPQETEPPNAGAPDDSGRGRHP